MTDCAPPTICGPRTFWAFQKMSCAVNQDQCGDNIACVTQDLLSDPSGGLLKQGWLRSLIYMLLGTDRQTTCYNATKRRRGNPADAFRTIKSGNNFYAGYKGSTSEQLQSLASDLQGQISTFLKYQKISSDVTVKATFAGNNQAKLTFTIAQQSVSLTGRREVERNSFVWNNI